MATGILKVQGNKVVDGNGKTVVLRGAGLGGWMKYDALCPTCLPVIIRHISFTTQLTLLPPSKQYGKLHNGLSGS